MNIIMEDFLILKTRANNFSIFYSVKNPVIFDVWSNSVFGHLVFGIYWLNVFRCSVIRCSVIRCSDIRCTVIRHWVFRCWVIRCTVIRRSVFRRSVGESIELVPQHWVNFRQYSHRWASLFSPFKPCVVVWGSPARNKVVKYILMLVT
jgi:hypothetical protein